MFGLCTILSKDGCLFLLRHAQLEDIRDLTRSCLCLDQQLLQLKEQCVDNSCQLRQLREEHLFMTHRLQERHCPQSLTARTTLIHYVCCLFRVEMHQLLASEFLHCLRLQTLEEISHLLTRSSEILLYPPYRGDPSTRFQCKGNHYEVGVRWLVGEDYFKQGEVLAKAHLL